jgi:hypothetical protein
MIDAATRRADRRPTALRFRAILGLFAALLAPGCRECEFAAPAVPEHNARPTFHGLSDTCVVYGDTLRLRVQAVDPDGDDVRYEVSPILTWGDVLAGYEVRAAIDARTGDFRFSPGPRDTPFRSFEFTAEDEHGARTARRVKVSVR